MARTSFLSLLLALGRYVNSTCNSRIANIQMEFKSPYGDVSSPERYSDRGRFRFSSMYIVHSLKLSGEIKNRVGSTLMVIREITFKRRK